MDFLYLGDLLDDSEDNGPAWSDRDYTYEEVKIFLRPFSLPFVGLV